MGTCASVVSSSNSRQIYDSSITSYKGKNILIRFRENISNQSNSSSKGYNYSNPSGPKLPARALLANTYETKIRIPKNYHNLVNTGVYVDEDCYWVHVSSKYDIEVVVENRIFKNPIKGSKLLGRPWSDVCDNLAIFMGNGEIRTRLYEGQKIQENEVEVKLIKVK